MPNQYARSTLFDYFNSRYQPEPRSGCWLWIGCRFKNGYGKAWREGQAKLAHRISWQLFKGEIPGKQFVLHKCDVRNCVNPDHLFLGTSKDNYEDSRRKGRNSPYPTRKR